MIVAGIDVGSRSCKVVIMDDGKIIASAIRDTGPDGIKTSYLAIETTLKKAGLILKNIHYVVATGYGRVLVPFANENISEISCHARGLNWHFPSVRTILDIGGQDCKAIRCDGKGNIISFAMNDKCAGGTGRFLELIAQVLGVKLEDIGEMSLKSKKEVRFSTVCAVFAKSEALLHLRNGAAKEDILAGLHTSIATRSYTLLKQVTVQPDFAITGGVAKNRGLVAKLGEIMGLEPLICEEPQLVGALGAALFAQQKGNLAPVARMNTSYGYIDGNGVYYITVDNNKCNGCEKCVPACPAGILELSDDGSGQSRAQIIEKARNKISSLCPGFVDCSSKYQVNCHSVCPKDAISHTW